jgi:hypothetical protein
VKAAATILLPLVMLACAVDSPATSQAPACGGGTWTVLEQMNERREYPAPVALADGRLLAVSGHYLESGTIESAEIFDLATKRWSLTGSLHNARQGGGGVLLESGSVLVGDAWGMPDHHPSELYDPDSETWSIVGKMNVDRQNYTLTRLADGSVLAAGGINWTTEETLATAELYDPASGSWRMTAALDRPRFGHHAISLPDDRVLVIGGSRYPQALDEPISCVLYDPETETWTAAATMQRTFAVTGVVALRDGRVLALGRVGGDDPFNNPELDGTAEIYDPATERWRVVTPAARSREQHPLVQLDDGRILAMGGTIANGDELTVTEVYDADGDAWTELAPMNVPRRNHGAALLADGSVLVMGGSNGNGRNYLAATELFTPCN